MNSLSSFGTSSHVALVIADDLTGACDAGTEFAKRGFITRVGSGTVPQAPADVLVVSTNSRGMPSSVARNCIATIRQHLPAKKAQVVFRKIDSTLRGNIVDECNALMELLGFSYGVVAPSLPAQNRTVNGGVLRVRDVSGEWTLNAVQLLESQGASVAALPLHDDSHRLSNAMEQAASNGARYILCDAETDKDLHRVAQAIQSCHTQPLWIGSSGLAAQAASLLPVRVQSPADSDAVWKNTRAASLLCVGSNHAVSHLQMTHLCNTFPTAILDVSIATPAQVQNALANDHAVVLRMDLSKIVPKSLREQLYAAIKAGLARLLMTGGDTAEMICRIAETDHILLKGEILPGVAEGIIHGGLLDGILIATKSGGFGQEDCLTQLLSCMATEKRPA
jgi:uncharacterized protein YgbK (DUF1537 family)